MALVLKDRVWESSTSTGTGNFVLAGTKTGYRTFSSVLANGDTCFYTIVADDGLWETGLATYNSGTNSLTRTTRYDNSSGTTAAINFAAGAKEVFLSLPASRFVEKLSSSANLQDLTDASSARSNLGLGTAAVANIVDGAAGGGNGVLQAYPNRLEMGRSGSGDRTTYIDLIATGDPGTVDYSARIIRNSGVNGALQLENTGTGNLALSNPNGLITATSNAEAKDTTSNRILTVGNFGLGLSLPITGNSENITTTGFYRSEGTATNVPVTASGGQCIVSNWSNTSHVNQLWFDHNANPDNLAYHKIIWKIKRGGTWATNPVELLHTSNTTNLLNKAVTTSTTLAGNSDSNVPTEKAVKTYADTKVPKTTTVNGKALSGNISLTKTDVGLGNVDDVKQLPNSYLDTSGTLASNSDVKVPSQKAVKTYVDNKVEGSPFRNRIMNGDFLINQRRGTDAITLTATGYNADRWAHGITQASKMSSQTITGGSVVGSKNYLRMKTVSAATLGSGDAFGIMQSIEGVNVQDFALGTAEAVQITLSFWVRASQTGTYNVAFRNNGGSRSYVTTYTINTANTWEYKTITINGDTSGTWKNDADVGLSVYFDFGSGSTLTTSSTNTWLAGNFIKSTGTKSLITTLNATLDLALVQLEKGGVATPFEYLPVADSLARCNRYYQVCYANTRGYGNAPGANIETPIQFRAQMRAIPSATLVAGTRGNVSSVTISSVTTIGARHFLISTGAGDTFAVGEFALFDAEL